MQNLNQTPGDYEGVSLVPEHFHVTVEAILVTTVTMVDYVTMGEKERSLS